MKNIKKFSEFSSHSISESLTPLEMEKWPSNWKSMPIWKDLEDMGFEETTTTGQARNGSIMIRTTNPGIFRIYPEGIVLQPSGYIRDKGVSSGFIKRYSDDFKLYDMFKYLADRFGKELKRLSPSGYHGPLTQEQVSEINLGTKSKWFWNNETQSVDIKGSFIQSKNSNAEILFTINFGNIKGNFEINRGGGLDSLEFLPVAVEGNLSITARGIVIQDLKTFPTLKVGKDLRIGCDLKSMSGFSDLDRNIGGFICNYFTAIPFNTETVAKIMETEAPIYRALDYSTTVYVYDVEEAKELVLTSGLVSDEYFKKNPLDLRFLKNLPELKAGILKRTGLKDFSDLGNLLSGGHL